jgi:hypothetical protein
LSGTIAVIEVSMNDCCKPATRSKFVLLVVVAAAILLAAGIARAEASHHTGAAAAGQVAGIATAAQAQLLASEADDSWRVRIFTSYLHSSSAFNDGGSTVQMASGSRAVNYALNLLAERRLGQRWHLSALSGWQLLDLRDAAGTSHVSSLTDSFLSARYAVPVSWGALSAITSVKVPGTYPESSLTSTKQLDAEVGGLATIAAWSRATFVIGAGYKVRFGGVQDEVTATVLVPVRVVDRLSITPLLVGAVPIGIGEVARNSVTAGGSLAFRLTSAVELSAAYYRTVLGRNVALSDVGMFGLGVAF